MMRILISCNYLLSQTDRDLTTSMLNIKCVPNNATILFWSATCTGSRAVLMSVLPVENLHGLLRESWDCHCRLQHFLSRQV